MKPTGSSAEFIRPDSMPLRNASAVEIEKEIGFSPSPEL
jgi:hypothetical protein